jgi:hypothetical protein
MATNSAPIKEEVKPEVAEVKETKASKVRYFRNREFAGLKIVLNAQVDDPTMVEFVKFTPVMEKYQGDAVKVGYLQTSDPVVIARCEADVYCEEIEEKEFPKQLLK